MLFGARVWVGFVGAVLIAGCDGCGDHRVPFGDTEGATVIEPPPARDPGAPFEPIEGQALPEGTRRVAIEGAPIEVASGSIRSLLAIDLDRDGDRDALLVSARDDQGAELAIARREGPTFEPLSALTRLDAREGCTIARSTVRAASPRYGVAGVERRCAGDLTEQTFFIAAIDGQPRALERVTLLPETGRWQGRVAVALRTLDHDRDGHEDVVLEVSVTPPGAAEPAVVSLPWLDRPSGLARDTREPEAKIAELAARAKDQLRGQPRDALATASLALGIHGALCRERDGARIELGGAQGIACGRSAGAGRAAAVRAAALVKTGAMFEALAALAELDHGSYRVTDADRRIAQRAFDELPATEGLVWREVTEIERAAAPDVRLPLVGFVDRNTLILREGSPRIFDLAADEGRGVSEHPQASPLVVDPSGRFAAVDVRRTCDGYVVVIVPASSVVAGVVAGRPVGEPLIEPRAPPPGARCPSVPATAANDDGGWRILGWAPQGIVAVRGEATRVVPLTADAQPAGAPSELDPGTPPPAPLPPGAATPDGTAWVVATNVGVLRRAGGRTTLLRPEGWATAPTPASDAAISPEGTRVAVLRGTKVYVMDLPR